MSRKYSAIITQVGPDRIGLSGARCATLDGWTANVIDYGHYGARVAPDSVTFYLGELGCVGYLFFCDGYSVWRSSPLHDLPSGRVTLAISPTVLSGDLDGAIGIYTPSARITRHTLNDTLVRPPVVRPVIESRSGSERERDRRAEGDDRDRPAASSSGSRPLSCALIHLPP